jgi:Zinc finger, ZZ type
MPVRRARKGKQGKQGKGRAAAKPKDPPVSTDNAAESTHADNGGINSANYNNNNSNDPIDLILTSDKRRGVYECDYCHNDISQTLRIRCAVCEDFDLCCDCFATTDHVAMAKHIRAMNGTGSNSGTGAGSSSHVLLHKQNHDPLTHGYRVCDSCRYPMFPVKNSFRIVAQASYRVSQNGSKRLDDDGKSDDAMDLDVDDEKQSSADEKKGVGGSTTENAAVGEATPIDDSAKSTGDATLEINPITLQVSDDPKLVWTVEEDLRLLQGIESQGLGNWVRGDLLGKETVSVLLRLSLMH